MQRTKGAFFGFLNMWPTKIWGAVWSDPRCIKMWPSISFWSLFFEFLLIPAMAWLMPCFFLLEALCFTSGHVFSLLSRHLNTFSLFQSCWLDGPFAIWLVTLSKQRMTICSTWVKHVWNSVIPNPDHTRVFFPSRLVIVSDKSQKRTCSQNYKFENAIELLVLCLISLKPRHFPANQLYLFTRCFDSLDKQGGMEGASENQEILFWWIFVRLVSEQVIKVIYGF